MPDHLPELQTLFRDVLDAPDLVLTRASSGHNVAGWDSFAHINLVSAIEEAYQVTFALGELQDLKHVGDMIDLLDKKLSAR